MTGLRKRSLRLLRISQLSSSEQTSAKGFPVFFNERRRMLEERTWQMEIAHLLAGSKRNWGFLRSPWLYPMERIVPSLTWHWDGCLFGWSPDGKGWWKLLVGIWDSASFPDGPMESWKNMGTDNWYQLKLMLFEDVANCFWSPRQLFLSVFHINSLYLKQMVG